jgi:hypothetical protein
MPKRNLAFAVALFILVGVLSLRGSLPSVQSDTWAATGNMNEARAGAAAALLPDGRLLVTGGTGSNGATSSAEVFNPTGSFSNVAPMVHARSHHAAVALLDRRGLVAGGRASGGGTTNSAEVYDPASLLSPWFVT